MEASEVKRGMIRLATWLQSKKWKLKRGKSVPDEINFDLRLITNHITGPKEHQYYSLLHECGHLSLGRPVLEKLCSANARIKKTRYFRVSKALNEARAWDAGERLAGRLGISYNPLAYVKYRSIYLVKYFRWASKGKVSQKSKRA